MKNFHLYLIVSTFILASCGGGGGGGGGSTPTTPTTPAPTVNLSAEPTSVLLESTSTLTWSSTNATSCSASWTSQTGTSGSEAITITTAGNNSFSITCTGAGGNGSASVTVEGYRETDGVVVDGYISGAEVFIDEDDDWVLDSNENSTTSDNEGKFTIRYANGNLVSIGGTDLDSQTLLDNLLITHKLTGHSDFKAVTPVTSVAAFMEDASLVNVALGIDSSIDIFTFDPVANKGDGSINDYLYEKGNQLTVLAFALQNITNNLNTTTETTQDYFKAITEEIEKEYTETETRVDIETEAFVTKALDNVIAAKSVTIDETAKTNTTKALAGVMPIIEVKSSDDLTTSVIRFAISTMQTDVQAIANGTATADIVASYTNDILNYIASDQDIDSISIAPTITAITDSATTNEDSTIAINVLANDSYVTSAPISLSDVTNGENGTTSVTDNQISYTPDDNYNGSDTFSYTINQANNTSTTTVTVNVEPVNDPPSIDTSSSLSVAEGVIDVATIEVSDIDGDTELTLTLSGTDAESFNLSSEKLLSFVDAPVYAEKSQYEITLELSDGALSITKDITISIQNPNSPPTISSNTVTEDENIISLTNLTLSDADIDQLSVSIIPTPPAGNFIPREIGTVDDLDGKETITLGNEDGTPLIISTDTTFSNETVKIISNIQLADGVKLEFLNSGVFSLNENNFPTIEVRGGTFDCESSKMRRLDISFIDGDQNNPGFIDISRCSWIKGILSRPSGNAVYGGFRIMYSYLEGINRGAYAYIWYPDNLYFEGNQIYNSGGFSIGYRASDLSGKQLGIAGNVFVNSENAIPVATGDCINSVHICLWAAYGVRSLPISENSFLTTNIKVLQQIYDVSNMVRLQDNYWGITSGDISSRYYSNIDNLSYGEVCNGICGSPRYSVSPNDVLPPEFQPRLIYDGDYTFSFDVAPDYEAPQRKYYYDITFSDGEFTVTEPVTIQINNVID